MKKWLMIILLSVSATLQAQPSAIKLTVNTEKPGIRVSPMLYGIFFEDVNRAGDGGLYAEMINNRSFEDSDKLIAWKISKGGGMEASATLDRSQPLNPNNPTSLRIEVSRLGDKGITLSNDGFQGMSIVKGATYTAQFYARCDDAFNGSLTVALESHDGEYRVQANANDFGREWKKFELHITAEETDPTAHFTITDNSRGVVWVDMVSLFPADTWKAQPNGFRKDLAEFIDQLHPSFLRFPGGCLVEGENLNLSYRWKQTLGDISQRPSIDNFWKYKSTNGLGYYEYLDLCEQLHAEPLLVVNCGMSTAEQSRNDAGKEVSNVGVEQWVQDALDAIEYANGSPETKWGAIRVQAGHPAPFNLKYVEIGNENGGTPYDQRYALFYDAIKKAYPDMNLVADLLYAPPKNRPIEILDEHYYKSPDFFITNSNRYDSYDRKGPKIYVGEYAVTDGGGLGNVRAAVAEAAFMTGMERNSDVVVMASYAPLLANVHYKNWDPDAINFDASRAYGTPSYWVQQMFSRNRAEQILPTDISGAAPKAIYAVAGQAGHDIVLKIVNTSDQPQSVEINLPGQSRLESNGTAIVLSGNPADENSLDQPTKIQPQSSEIENVSDQFTRTLPASSVTILRLKLK